ncbi:uncharacterized protein LOC144448643 [Glandiceps talaboti]
MDNGNGNDLKSVDVEVLDTTFSVQYADIGPHDGPIAVFLHGSPATYKAFKKMFQPITERGVRMILPNMPGMGYTKIDDKGIFDFTSYQKAEILKAFIKALDIKRIETMVGYSLAGHIVARVAGDENFDILKSVTLLSGIGIRPHRLVRPLAVVKILGMFLYWTLRIPIIGSLIARLFKPIYGMLDLRGKTLESNCYSVYEGAKLNFEECHKDLLSISSRKLPILLFHSEDDPITEKEIAEENMEILGLTADDVIRYDNNGHSTQTFPESKLHRAVWFAKGGHRLQNSQTDVVSEQIPAMVFAVSKNIH